MRIGVTGHIGLDPGSRGPIYRALCRHLRSIREPVHGVSCLADGADRLFVNAVLVVRGTFEVVLPVSEVKTAGRDPELSELLDLASEITRVEVPGEPEAAYEAANLEMLRRCDVLVAVWDGDRRGGRGGTADTVALARSLDRAVQVVWPAGSQRRGSQSRLASNSASALIVS